MKRLTIKDVKKIIGNPVGYNIGGVGTYICKDVIEDQNEYVFHFEQKKMSGSVTKRLFLERYSDYTDKGKFLYAIREGKNRNVVQYVSADWFTFDNAVKSLGERL